MTMASGARHRVVDTTSDATGGLTDGVTDSMTDDEIRTLLSAVLANSTEAIVVVDEGGSIRLATEGVAQLLGHDPDVVLGASVFDFLHPDDAANAADLFVQRLGYVGRDPGKEMRVRHSSGDWIDLTATVSLLPSFASAAITLRTGLDGSRERSLQRRIAIAECVNELGADLLGAAASTAVLDRIRRSLADIGLLSGAEIVAVYLERRSTGTLELLSGWSSPLVATDAPFELAHDAAAVERLLTAHTVVDDLDDDRHASLRALAAPARATGLLATPIDTADRRGVVLMLRTRRGVSWWDSDSDLARGVAALYGRALHAVWSEELLASTYAHGPVAFSIRTWEGHLVDCNQRYLDLLRLTPAEARDRPLAELLVDGLAATGDPWIGLRDEVHDRVEQEFEVRRGDGSRIWVRSSSVRLQLPGAPEQHVLTALDDITERRRQRIELEHAASHDALTGVGNRTAMVEAIERWAATGRLPTLLMVDLDRFKLVNDGHGHAVGDAVLMIVARRIAQQIRSDDLVARLGGDEFAIVVPELGPGAATDLADRIRRSLREPLFIDGRHVTQTVSVGIALGAHATDVSDLLVRADRALYSAKHQGRNRHVVFDHSMRDEVLSRLTVERDLRRAIDGDQFDVHFQPMFDVARGGLVGAEALVRWIHPTRGLVPAAEFVPVAEASGLIDEIGRIALRRATAGFARLTAGRDDLDLWVNVSAGEFARSELADLVTDALAASGLAASRLCIEITETTLMDAPDVALGTLQELRRAGIRCAIDDFGTGYSSLVYLKRFPIDAIKIDRGFVHDLLHDRESRAIIESVVGLCRALSLDAVAEGVESAEQLAALAEMGCPHAQGYHLGGVLPPDEFAALLAR